MMKIISNEKRGSAGIPLGILLSLVLIAMLLVGCVNMIRDNPLLSKKNLDNSEKLVSFNSYIQDIGETTSPETKSQIVRLETTDLFLFFSKGADPIKIEYTPKKTGVSTEGDFIFKRPDVEECKDKACICYSSDAQLWQYKDISPYLFPFRLYVSKGNDINEWEDPNINCVEASNPNAIFVNSRGQDSQFIDYDSQLLPLEVPMALQTKVNNTIRYIFLEDAEGYISQSQKANYYRENMIVRRKLLKEDYVWKGGVAIGGMGLAQTSKERSEYRLSVPLFNMTFQRVPDTDIIGVCIQDKCLYQKGIENAKEQAASSQDTSQALKNFEYLESDLSTNFQTCMNNKNIDSSECVKALQSNILNIFPEDNDQYDIRFYEASGITKIDLRNEGLVLSTITFPYPMPTVAGNSEEEIIVNGAQNNNLMIESKEYKMKIELDQDDRQTINFVS